MATQTVEFRAATGLTITAKLFSAASDTEVASVSATEATNRKGTYSAAFTDVAAGEYMLLALSSGIPVASWWVTLTLSTATFQVYDRGNAPSASAVASQVRTELTTELGRIDANITSRLASASYSAPPSASAVASQTRTELATELGRIDAAITSRATPADVSEHAVAVSITPLKGQQEQRVIDSDIVGYINDRSSIGTIAVTEDDGITPVDVSAFSSNARIWIEPSSGTGTRYEVTPTVSGDDGNLISFTLPAAIVAAKSTWLWSLRDITGASAGEGRHVIGGTLTIKRAARAPE